ncbi:MAG: peptide chain release factor 1 [Chloroflexi bacterium]|nr:peptide chain release factor 1 [Chloroflexota bacterium]
MATAFDRLEQLKRRYDELAELLAQPEVIANLEQLQALAREQSSLTELVGQYDEYRQVLRQRRETEEMLDDDSLDAELAALARDEVANLRARERALLAHLEEALAPRDPDDERNVIVEIRAGAGGEEAALFAGDLYRTYSRYAERRGWKTELIDLHETELGGIREVIFEIRGRGAYARLKYESGVHRVQRVPQTEANGRIHTSTATVATLPEVEEIDVEINPDDLRIDIYCSSGAGGQNVNKVATAVRVTHLPTGIVVACQDERSQLKNRMKAMAVLRARLYQIEQQKQQQEIDATRRAQVGSGDRSEKIRTYNFPQDRVTDHRIGVSVHRLEGLLDGDLDDLIDALAADERVRRQSGTN